VREDMLSSQAFQWLRDLTESARRSAGSAISVRMQPAMNER